MTNNKSKEDIINDLANISIKSYEEENKILITLSFGAVGFLAHKLLIEGYNVFLLVGFLSFSLCLIFLITYYWILRKNIVGTIKHIITSGVAVDKKTIEEIVEKYFKDYKVDVAMDEKSLIKKANSDCTNMLKEFSKHIPKYKYSKWLNFWNLTKFGLFLMGTISSVLYVIDELNIIKLVIYNIFY